MREQSTDVVRLTDAERDAWIADGADALRRLVGRDCPKRDFFPALDCPYCLSDALLDMHAAGVAAARADERERWVERHEVAFMQGNEVVCSCGDLRSNYGLTKTLAACFALHLRDVRAPHGIGDNTPGLPTPEVDR